MQRKLGKKWKVSYELCEALELFTCFNVLRQKNSITKYFAKQNDKKLVGDDLTPTTNSIVDLARLPPCFGNLLPHITYRVNHRLSKRADEPLIEAPNPYNKQGWIKN